MNLQINIGKALRTFHLEEHGRINELAKRTGLHRHTVRRLIDGTAPQIGISALSELCRWFHEHGVPMRLLPHVLFQFEPDELWKDVAARGNVALCVGEYREEDPDQPTRLWINRRDVAVVNAIMAELNRYEGGNGRAPAIHPVYVPFRFAKLSPQVRKKHLKEDTAAAIRIFKDLPSRRGQAATIMVGSQDVCYTVECLVADLFGCKPFAAPEPGTIVPIHVKSRHPATSVESCFGGGGDPPGIDREVPPGLYHLDRRGRWLEVPRIEGEQDAGIVIVVWDTSLDAIELAMFGVSGRATAAMVEYVVNKSERFWPPYCACGAKRVGVHICRFELDPTVAKEPFGDLAVRNFETYPVDGAVLRKTVR